MINGVIEQIFSSHEKESEKRKDITRKKGNLDIHKHIQDISIYVFCRLTDRPTDKKIIECMLIHQRNLYKKKEIGLFIKYLSSF